MIAYSKEPQKHKALSLLSPEQGQRVNALIMARSLQWLQLLTVRSVCSILPIVLVINDLSLSFNVSVWL